MRRLLPLPAAVILTACQPAADDQARAPAPPPDPAAVGAEVAAFAGELREALRAALADGGAPGAIEVCRERAPALAAAHSERTGWTIRRSALRLRNQANAPDEWERRQLGDFAARLAAGEDPAGVTAFELLDGRARFAKAIPTAPECLLCHGPEPAPEVRAALASLYPDDRATGFRQGELRGIFSVSIPLDR